MIQHYAFFEAHNTSIDMAVECARKSGAVGVAGYWGARSVHEGWTEEFAAKCKDNGLESVAFIRYLPGEKARLAEVHPHVTRVCAGNDRFGEFNSGPETIEQYREDADKNGYHWVCPLIHPGILWDIGPQGRERRRIALGTTRCFCLTGYVLWGYLYADSRFPCHRDALLNGVNPALRWGLSVKALRDYLSPMDVWSGANWQAGLDAGAETYAARTGFKGLVVGMPYQVSRFGFAQARDEPQRLPAQFGGKKEYDTIWDT